MATETRSKYGTERDWIDGYPVVRIWCVECDEHDLVDTGSEDDSRLDDWTNNHICPPVCPSCEEPLTADEAFVCAGCVEGGDAEALTKLSVAWYAALPQREQDVYLLRALAIAGAHFAEVVRS